MYVEKRELRVALDHSRVPVAMDITGSEKSGTSQYQLTNISRTGMFLERPKLFPRIFLWLFPFLTAGLYSVHLPQPFLLL